MRHSIDELIDDVLRREGGFVNDPVDRGGATKFGITQRTLSRFLGRAVTVDEVQSLSEGLAREIYERNYFLGPGIQKLPERVQPFVFDSAVNHGPRRAIRFVQRVCNQAGFGPLDEDGVMGPHTAKVAEEADKEMGNFFLAALVEERRNFYRVIVENDPGQQRFLRGWMRRVDEFDVELDMREGVA